ncbi:hypothetical protein [Streptomyces albireticuli]|uniref:hypothetical protein n=1 Tax=Streptomyces albireticuli TaxID=1940 RepID=UPI00117E3EC6|nr:hypothetical protein [Streptomyces albireticuli]MCD9193483.1 hypothetical protein [Streptomyces albireticuli]
MSALPGGFVRLPRRCAVAVAVTTAALTLAVPARASAAEPPPCRARPAEAHVDWTGRNFTGDFWCELEPGWIRIQSRSTSAVIGRMEFSPGWLVCWKKGSDYLGDDRWYYTQGDRVLASPASKAWGYMPAVAVKAPKHPVAGMPECPWTDGSSSPAPR